MYITKYHDIIYEYALKSTSCMDPPTPAGGEGTPSPRARDLHNFLERLHLPQQLTHAARLHCSPQRAHPVPGI